MGAVITTLGVDPGKTTGFLLARWALREPDCPGLGLARKASWALAFTASMDSSVYLLEALLNMPTAGTLDAAQIEAYDRRRRSGMTTGVNERDMQALITRLERMLSTAGIKTHVRQVASVKTWACCGDRMAKSGLAEAIPAKMIDATSAGWHTLYTAVKDCGMTDPASRKGRESDGAEPSGAG